MRKITKAIVSIASLAFADPTMSADLRIKEMSGMCLIKGSTAEEVALLQILDRTIDKEKIYYSDVFVVCDTLDEIKAGKTEYFYPLFIVMSSKTGGKLLPFATMTIPKLKAQMETALDLHDFNKEAIDVSNTINEMAAAASQPMNMDIKPDEQGIVDVTDKTISVAQKSAVTLNGKTFDQTTIATSIIVDGYVATIQGSGIVETAKDFWRLQFMTEWAAREIEVVK